MLSTFPPKSEKAVLACSGSRRVEARGPRPPLSTLPPLGRTPPSPRFNVVGAYGARRSAKAPKSGENTACRTSFRARARSQYRVRSWYYNIEPGGAGGSFPAGLASLRRVRVERL